MTHAKYREGKVNCCFLLPIQTSADLHHAAIEQQTSIRELLTDLVEGYLYGPAEKENTSE